MYTCHLLCDAIRLFVKDNPRLTRPAKNNVSDVTRYAGQGVFVIVFAKNS